MSQKKKLLEQKRREEAAKKAAQSKKNMIIATIVTGVVIIVVIAGALIFDATRGMETVVNYSVGLDSEGKVKGVNTSDHVILADLNNLNMNAEDYYPSAEEEEEYLKSLTDTYPDLSKTAGIEVKEGDMINIDFVGYVNGAEYEGGNTNGAGTKLTIGEGNFVEEFENGLIGNKVGEPFKMTVPYAEDFGNEELAGEDVEYEVTINGIYHEAAFNDEFVKKNFGDRFESAEDFKNKYRMDSAQTTFDEYVQNYIISESEIKSYPSKYLKQMKKFFVQKEKKQLETVTNAYKNMGLEAPYKDVPEMRSMTKAEYKVETENNAKEEIKKNLVLQGYFEQLGLSITDEDVKAAALYYGFEEDEYDSAVAMYKEPYLRQQAMFTVVKDYLKENYNLSE